jgi:hypothetical protein
VREQANEEDDADDRREGAEMSREAAETPGSLTRLMRENPIGAASLLGFMVLGAILSYSYLDAGLSDVRRLTGGALAGGGSWLCIFVGRAIG